MNKKNSKYSIFIAPIISMIIIIGIYIVKGIYPFGAKTGFQADLASYTAVIKYLMELLKNGELGKLFFTDTVLAGTNIISVISYINPFLIIYFLCNNLNNLLYFMPIAILIKFALCSITSYICFYKIFGKDNSKQNIVFSLLYSFSAYAFINYTTLFWIDVVILFPILIIGLKNIFDKQSFFLYSIILAMCLGIAYQLSYMIILSIIITVFMAIKIFDKLENKKRIIMALGIGTLLGILLSSVIFLPTAEIFLKSARNSLDDIAVDSNIFYNKLSYILFSVIMFFPLIETFKYIKKDKNIQFFIFSIIMIGIIPIFFEGVNIIFHGGQYDQFPFRYGFIPLFFMNLLANYFYKNLFSRKEDEIKSPKIDYVFFIISIGLLYITSITINISNPTFRIYPATVIMLILYNLFMYVALKLMQRRGALTINKIFVIAIMEITILAFGFFGINENVVGREHSDIPILKGIEITKEFDEQLDYNSGYKYKDLDNLMLENTSLYTGIPSTSSWSFLTKEQMESYINLGYSNLYMRLNNVNGTIFSDALMGMKYLLTQNNLNEKIYDFISETSSGIKLYEYKDVLPIGIVYERNNNINEIPNNLNLFEYQNWIYKKLFNRNDNILNECDYAIKSINGEYENKDNIIKIIKKDLSENSNEKRSLIEKNTFVELEIDIKNSEILYFYTNDEIEEYSLNIKINDEILNVPSTNNLENIYYPVLYNNGILNLGYYENEKVNVKIYFENELNLDYLNFATLDYSKYKEIVDNKIDTEYKCEENLITININAKKNQNIFIPVAYDKYWKATVNGNQVEVGNALGGMIFIELEEGANEIKLTNINPLIKIGGIISIISLILLIILDKFRNKILNINILNIVSYCIFIMIAIITILYVYFLGIISSFL